MHIADSAADPLLKLNLVLYAAASIANKDKIQSRRSAVPTTNLLMMLHFGRNLRNIAWVYGHKFKQQTKNENKHVVFKT